jgi:hypothetical protein
MYMDLDMCMGIGMDIEPLKTSYIGFKGWSPFKLKTNVSG